MRHELEPMAPNDAEVEAMQRYLNDTWRAWWGEQKRFPLCMLMADTDRVDADILHVWATWKGAEVALLIAEAMEKAAKQFRALAASVG